MVENTKVLPVVKTSYDANPAISEAVTNILHSSDLTSLTALAHQASGSNREQPPRVKRPMNAFMLYAQVARRKVATKYPNLNYAKLSKTLGKIWQVLPEEERRPFLQEAERLRTQHKLKHPDYKYTPKRLKGKKHHASSVKKTRFDNLKPRELFNIIQAKCEPSTIQSPVQSDGNCIPCEEQLQVYCDTNNNYDSYWYTGQAFNAMNSPTPTSNYEWGSFQGFEYQGDSTRGSVNGLESVITSSTPNNNTLKCYLPDYNETGQLLGTFNNPNSPITQDQDPNQPLTAFLNTKPEASTTHTPLTNTFGEGLSLSKLIDPIENFALGNYSYNEGKSYYPEYVTI